MTERIILKGNDVISMEQHKSLTHNPTSKVHEIREEMDRFIDSERKAWFHSAVKCEVLLARGGGWMKGKVRFVCDFIPDEKPVPKKKQQLQQELPPGEPPSPLDDLREQLNS